MLYHNNYDLLLIYYIYFKYLFLTCQPAVSKMVHGLNVMPFEMWSCTTPDISFACNKLFIV